jgi:hypothetical protein
VENGKNNHLCSQQANKKDLHKINNPLPPLRIRIIQGNKAAGKYYTAGGLQSKEWRSRSPPAKEGRREGKMVNKQEVTAAIQEKHQETIEKLNRLWEQYNKEFNENPSKCNKEEYVQKSEYLLGYCSGLMEVCRMLVQDIK